MAQSLRKFLISFFLPAVLIISLSAAIGVSRINNLLSMRKEEIVKQLAVSFNQKVLIPKIEYLFPNTIILKDLSLIKEGPFKKSPTFFIEKLKLRFSLLTLFTRGSFFVSGINIDRFSADYSETVFFIKDNIQRIYALINNLPKTEALNLTVKEASLKLMPNDKDISYLNINMLLRMERSSFFSSGIISQMALPASGMNNKIGAGPAHQTWQYSLKGYLTQEGLAIDGLELTGRHIYAKLWGVLEKNILRFNGFLSARSFWQSDMARVAGFNLVKRLKSLAGRKTATAQITRAAMPGLNFFDISAVIAFSPKKIEIQSLNFSLNNIPFSLGGDISFSAPLSIDLMVSSYPFEKPQSGTERNPLIFSLGAKGNFQKNRFNGIIGIDFFRNVGNNTLAQKVETAFKNLSFDFSRGEYPKVAFDEADFTYRSQESPYRLFFANAKASFYFKDNLIRLMRLDSLIYDGVLTADGRVNLNRAMPQCEFDLEVKKISADKLKGLLIHFSKVEGALDSRLHYQNYPSSVLGGTMTMSEGCLNNFEFFKWLADFFALPLLGRINFDTLSLDFLVDDTGAKLEHINLDSPDTGLYGYFGVSSRDLVNSTLSLKLSKNIIKDSLKLKPLARLLGKDFSALVFDFQLSGFSSSLNFKWLKSDFKKKIQDAIPGFIERSIERKVEEAIEGIAATEAEAGARNPSASGKK